MGIAEGPGWQSQVESLDGEDLTHLISAEANPERPIFAEYLAEATTAPILMIRRGRYKFILSEADPPLLFDLETDPVERFNLASDPAHADTLAQFTSEVNRKWDSTALTAQIIESQKRRRLILSGYNTTEAPRWNHGEDATDDVLWYRGKEGYNDWAFAYLPVLPEDS